MASSKIKIKFHNSSLSEEENNLAERAGMLALAADYAGDKKVNKAEKIVGITQAYLPIYLTKTKTNSYIALNPSSNNEVKLPITKLPDIGKLSQYFSDEKNLEISKIKAKLTEFTVENKALKGAIPKTDIQLIKSLLKAPREEGNVKFKQLPPVRSLAEIQPELDGINDSVYDEKRLEDEVNALINMVETKLSENFKEKKDSIAEREAYWSEKIANLKKEEQDNLKAREKQLDQDLKAIDKKAEELKKENMRVFIQGVAKNIRNDEKAIESQVQQLEALVKTPGNNPLSDISKSLESLSDAVETFKAAVSFAKDNVRRTQNKDGDIEADAKMERETLQKQYEADKQGILNQKNEQKALAENEKTELKSKIKESEKLISDFKSLKNALKTEIKNGVRVELHLMIEPELLNLATNPAQVEMLIPVYIFKYEKKDDHYYVVVPPLRVPDNMKKIKGKNIITGKHNSVFYHPIHEDITKITEWLETVIENNLEIRKTLDTMDNLATAKQENYKTYTEAKNMMINTLKVNEKEYKNVFGRLADVIS
jgi:hypothetical protein